MWVITDAYVAPTASTTASLALGDALAISVARVRGVSSEDFAIFHPGGSLGRRLLVRVCDLLDLRCQNPKVSYQQTVKEALFAMTSSRMGAVSVVDQNGKIVGIITDGDVRRGLQSTTEGLLEKENGCFMNDHPVTIGAHELAARAVQLMEENEITHLPVVDNNDVPIGMINIQDVLKAGIV